MFILKALLLSIIVSITLHASEIKLIKNINAVYSDDIYEKLLTLSSIPLFNYENNNTQKKVKEDFEKILPLYLEHTTLFSKTSLEKLDKNKIEKYKLNLFIKISVSYIKYLEQKNEIVLSTKIMKRNLLNLNALMTNSNNLMDYIISLMAYSTIFSHYSNPSKEMIVTFNNYPPPDASIYFEKIEAEKITLFNMIDNMDSIDNENMKDYDNSDYKKLMSQVRYTAKKQLNKYFSKMVVAIKSQSKIEKENFNKYIEEQQDSLLSIWSQVKFFIHTILAKLLHIFIGYNSQSDHMADYIGETLALTAVPIIDEYYEKHIKMKKQYITMKSTNFK